MNRQKRSDDISENSMTIRYSNQILFYSICVIGSLAIVSSTLLLSDVDWDIFFKPLSFIDHDILSALLFLSLILFATIMFFLPFFVSLYITDKKANVLFSKTGVEIQKSGETTRIDYRDIERIKFVTVLKKNTGGPHLYRVIIYTYQGKYKINCSFKEAWQCRNKKKKITIYPFTVMLEKQSGCKVEYTTNIWG